MTRRLPALSFREVVRALERLGFQITPDAPSHHLEGRLRPPLLFAPERLKDDMLYACMAWGADMGRARTLREDAATCTFTAVIEADAEDGGFVVTFPAIPNLATQGETLEEARQMAEDCLRGYVEVLRETGRPLPKPAGMPARTAGIVIELTIPAA